MYFHICIYRISYTIILFLSYVSELLVVGGNRLVLDGPHVLFCVLSNIRCHVHTHTHTPLARSLGVTHSCQVHVQSCTFVLMVVRLGGGAPAFKSTYTPVVSVTLTPFVWDQSQMESTADTSVHTVSNRTPVEQIWPPATPILKILEWGASTFFEVDDSDFSFDWEPDAKMGCVKRDGLCNIYLCIGACVLVCVCACVCAFVFMFP